MANVITYNGTLYQSMEILDDGRYYFKSINGECTCNEPAAITLFIHDSDPKTVEDYIKLINIFSITDIWNYIPKNINQEQELELICKLQ